MPASPNPMRADRRLKNWLISRNRRRRLAAEEEEPEAPAEPPTPPGPFELASITEAFEQPIIVGWSACAGALYFKVERALDDDFSEDHITVTGITGHSYAFTQAAYGTTYYLRVSAVNSAGEVYWTAPYGTYGIFTTAPEPAPGNFVSLGFSAVTGTSMNLNWQGSDRVVSYTVDRATDSNFSNDLQTFAGITENGLWSSSLTPGTNYYFRVTAHGNGGSTVWGVEGATYAEQTTSPGAFTFSGFSDITDGAITVNWSWSAYAQSYNVERDTDPGFMSGNYTSFPGVGGTSHASYGLTPGTNYYFRVTATDGMYGVGWASAYESAQTLTAPALFYQEAFTNIASNEITVNWSPSSHPNESITYTVELDTDNSFASPNHRAVGGITGNSHIWAGLNPATTYFFRVSAIAGQSSRTWYGESGQEWSDEATSNSPPGAFAFNGFSTIGQNNITVNWTSASDVSYYTVEVSPDSSFSWGVNNNSTGNNYMDVGGLNAGQTYFFRVTAYGTGGTTVWDGEYGPGSYADETTGTGIMNPSYGTQLNTYCNGYTETAVYADGNGGTYEVVVQENSSMCGYVPPPPPPEGFYFESFPNVTDSSITLQWTNSSGATSYTVERAQDNAFSSDLQTYTGIMVNSYEFTGLNSMTQYFFRVTAVNDYGSTVWYGDSWQHYAAVYTTYTPPPPPPGPGEFSFGGFSNLTDSSITVHWTTASDASYYNIERATDSGFSSDLQFVPGVTGNSYDFLGLNYGTTYYFRISAFNDSGSIAWFGEHGEHGGYADETTPYPA